MSREERVARKAAKKAAKASKKVKGQILVEQSTESVKVVESKKDINKTLSSF